MSDNDTHNSPEDEPEEGKLVEFPSESVRGEEKEGPGLCEKAWAARSLKTIFTLTISALVIILTSHFLYSLYLSNTREDNIKAGGSISDEFREDGTITVGNKPLRGWFLDPSHEHFMSQDGRRFTYINPHEREGSNVNGYWRIIK